MSLLALQQDFEHWLRREPEVLPASFDETHRPGLAVYLNNYRSQLLSCLTTSFPVVRAVMKEAAFDSAAARFVDASPPHSWTLDAYAEGFPEQLAEWFPDSPHLGDLARIELALGIAFVGVDAASLDPATLAEVDWDVAVVRLSPVFSLLRLTTNADAIWSAIQAGEPAPPPALQTTARHLAVGRRGFTTAFRVTSAEEARMFAMVCEGAAFGTICAALVQELGEADGTTAAGAVLGQWLADGVIVGVTG